jgi:hypothetical protein
VLCRVSRYAESLLFGACFPASRKHRTASRSA